MNDYTDEFKNLSDKLRSYPRSCTKHYTIIFKHGRNKGQYEKVGFGRKLYG